MAERDVNIRIRGRDQASQAIRQTSRSLKDLAKQSVGLGIGIASAEEAVNLLKQAIGKLIEFTREAIRLSEEQEKQEKLLAFAFRTLTPEYEAATTAAKDFASRLQEATGVGDEAILGVQRLLVVLGRLSGDELRRATQATLDFAAATGVELKSAAFLMAKAAQGQTESLSRYGLVLDKTIPQNEKFAELLKLISETMGGAAVEAANTYEGATKRLDAAWGDFTEGLGDFITQSPENVAAINALANSVEALARRTKQAARIYSAFFTLVAPERVAILQKIAEFFSGGKLEAAAPPTKPMEDFVEVETKVADGLDAIIEDAEDLKIILPDIWADAARDAEKYYRSLEEANETVTAVAPDIIDAWSAVSIAVQDGFAVLRARIENTKLEVESVGDTVNRELRDVGINAAFEFGDALVDAAFKGKFAFKQFFLALLQDLAKAIIRALILRAILSAIGVGAAAANTGRVPPATLFQRRAVGGFAHSAPSVDSIPALLAPGELVVSRPQAQRLFEAANQPSVTVSPTILAPEALAADLIGAINDLVTARGYRLVASEVA